MPEDITARILTALGPTPKAPDELQLSDVSPRSVQRRLADLVAAGRVRALGAGRARRYQLVEQPGQIPLSADSEALRAYVRQPISARGPVGYDRSLLEGYEPNRTAWIPESARRRLAMVGRRDADQPAGTYARQILERLLVDLSWASSRLEGNTYSRLDTIELLRFGRGAAGHDAIEAQMLLNHKAAIEMLVEGAERVGFDPLTFRNLHALLAENLLPDPHAGGRLRVRPVEIGRSVYLPVAIPSVIEECFREVLDKAAQIADPFEQAFFVMVQIPYLQPFEDVNKRVSRLGANIPFLRHNLAPLSFIDVPEAAYVEATLALYETGRIDYLRDVFVWAYERSAQQYGVIKSSLVQPDPFRLARRLEIRDAVSWAVRSRADDAQLQAYAAGLVPADDLPRLLEIVRDDLAHLHEGNAARYGLRPSEVPVR